MTTPDPRAPNLFILGAAKCGTTSLYRYLSRHPAVYFPANKEPQFYCNEELFARGERFYYETFYPDAAAYSVRGDATPHYLYYEKVAQRLDETPKARELKFIVILRDPVARAYSHYWNAVYEGDETLSFADGLAAESDRIADADLERRGTLTFHYVAAGQYARQLAPYLQRFSREQFLILFQEDLQREPESTMRQVFGFLGLTPVAWEGSQVHNESGQARSRRLQTFMRRPNRLRRLLGGWLPYPVKLAISQLVLRANKRAFRYPPLEPAVRERLIPRFSEDIRALEALTGRDLRRWRGE